MNNLTIPEVTVPAACIVISLILVPEAPATTTLTRVPDPLRLVFAVDIVAIPSLGDDANCGVAAIVIDPYL
jgi:hypothetical protein